MPNWRPPNLLILRPSSRQKPSVSNSATGPASHFAAAAGHAYFAEAGRDSPDGAGSLYLSDNRVAPVRIEPYPRTRRASRLPSAQAVLKSPEESAFTYEQFLSLGRRPTEALQA